MHEVNTGKGPEQSEGMFGTRYSNLQHVQYITSITEFRECVPEYTGEVSLPAVNIGRDIEDDWVVSKSGYTDSREVVVARLLQAIPDPVIIRLEAENPNQVFEHLDQEGFGDLLIGSLSTIDVNGDSVTVTVENPHYLTLCYGTALLVVWYEKEVSDRVLKDAPEKAIESIERKYNAVKSDLAEKINSGVGGVGEESVKFTRGDSVIYPISLVGDFASLY